MNRVVLIGRAVKDPNLKFTAGSGKAVTTFTLAVNRRFKKDGQQEADFIPIVVWGNIAESTANYVRKGSQVGISGRIQTRNYEGNDGIKRYVTEIVAEEVQFLDNKNNMNTQNDKQDSTTDFGQVVDDGDIPF